MVGMILAGILFAAVFAAGQYVMARMDRAAAAAAGPAAVTDCQCGCEPITRRGRERAAARRAAAWDAAERADEWPDDWETSEWWLSQAAR